MIRVRVIAPDMFGFQCRDFHPRESDIGVVATVVAMETQTVHPAAPELVIGPSAFHELAADSLAKTVADADYTFRVLYVVTDDGRKLTLIDQEVEVIK